MCVMKDTNRRGFLKGVATLSALGAVKCGSAMMPAEQAAYDKYNAMQIPRPEGLLDGEPVLQAPAPDSMGVAFAVTALSVVAGLLGGRAIGHRFGHWAEVLGGLVLIGIGVSFLI